MQSQHDTQEAVGLLMPVHIRIEKAATDAGFDLTAESADGWLVFRSTVFSVFVGVTAYRDGAYRLAVSDSIVGWKLGNEFALTAVSAPPPWALYLDAAGGYDCLYEIFQRTARIARVMESEGLKEFRVKTRAIPDSTEAVHLAVQRVGQDIFRQSLVNYWDSKCAATRLDIVELLRASHIKPWKDCASDTERLDVFNGLLLAPHLDALFDGGWVTFFDSGKISISGALTAGHCDAIGVSGQEVIAGLTERHKFYLAWHRKNVFRLA